MTTKSKGKVLFTIRRPSDILKALAYITKAMVVILCLVAIYSFNAYERPYDATDWPELEERSGLTLYIDYGTGCHWIKGGLFGTMQPRMDSHGRHVCKLEDFRPKHEDT